MGTRLGFAAFLLGGVAVAFLGATAQAAEKDLGRCGEHLYGYNPMKRYVLGVEFDGKSRFAKQEDALLAGLLDAIAKTPDRPSRSFNVLVLSGGGQWGAYGAGFLHGWSNLTDAHLAGLLKPEDRIKREEIDIVTGVSTGAMQTTLAYAGSLAQDVDGKSAADIHQELSHSYTDPNIGKLIERKVFDLIRNPNSIYAVPGLEKAVEKGINDYFNYFKRSVRQRAYVGLVDVDRNEFFVADLTGVAKSTAMAPAGTSEEASDQLKRNCLSQLILGSAAIPIGFPPRFIDKHMFIDGGARHALFGTILLTRPQVRQKLIDEGLTPHLHVIINGNQNANTYAKTPRKRTEDSFLPIVKASMRNVLDQLYKDAIYRTENDLKSAFGTKYRSRYAFVANGDIRASQHPQCISTVAEQSEDVFDPTFMGCLHKIGVDHGHAQKWMTFDAVPVAGSGDDDDVDEYEVDEK